MVLCKDFDMYTMSISELFGKSPKISYICGKCGNYNETRIPVKAVEMGKPNTICKYCHELNYIPIEIDRGRI